MSAPENVKEDSTSDEAVSFRQTVERMLNTPPKPHKVASVDKPQKAKRGGDHRKSAEKG